MLWWKNFPEVKILWIWWFVLSLPYNSHLLKQCSWNLQLNLLLDIRPQIYLSAFNLFLIVFFNYSLGYWHTKHAKVKAYFPTCDRKSSILDCQLAFAATISSSLRRANSFMAAFFSSSFCFVSSSRSLLHSLLQYVWMVQVLVY